MQQEPLIYAALALVGLCALLAYTLVVAILAAWLYSRGQSRKSPIPDAVAAVAKALAPAKTSEAPPPPPPEPSIMCPKCHEQKGWILSGDRAAWQCKSKPCGFKIPGPEPVQTS